MKTTNLNEKLKTYKELLLNHENFSGCRAMFDSQQFVPVVYGAFDSTTIEQTIAKAQKDIFGSTSSVSLEPAEELALIAESRWEDGKIDFTGSTYSLENNGSVPSDWNPVVTEITRLKENYDIYRVFHSPNQEIGTILRLRIARILYHLTEILSSADDDFNLFFREYFLKELVLVEKAVAESHANGIKNFTGDDLYQSTRSPLKGLSRFFYLEYCSAFKILSTFMEKISNDEDAENLDLKEFTKKLKSSLNQIKSIYDHDLLTNIYSLTEIRETIFAEIANLFHQENKALELLNSSTELSEYVQNILNQKEGISIVIDNIISKEDTEDIYQQPLLGDYYLDDYYQGEYEEIKEQRVKLLLSLLSDLIDSLSALMDAISLKIEERTRSDLCESYLLFLKIKNSLKEDWRNNKKSVHPIERFYSAITKDEFIESLCYKSAMKLFWSRITGKDDPLSIAAGLMKMLFLDPEINKTEGGQWLFKMINYCEIAISHYLRDTVEINQSIFADIPINLNNAKITSISDWTIKMLENTFNPDPRYPSHPFVCQQLKKDGWQNFAAKLSQDPFYTEYIKLGQKLPSIFEAKKNGVSSFAKEKGIASDVFRTFYNTFSYKEFIKNLDLSCEVIETNNWKIPIIFKVPISMLPKYNWFNAFLVDKAGTYVNTGEGESNIFTTLFSDRNIYLYDLLFLNPASAPTALIDHRNLAVEDDLMMKFYVRMDKMKIPYDSLAAGEIRNTSRGWLINQCLIAEQRLKEVRQVPGWLDLYRFLKGDIPNLVAQDRDPLECDVRAGNILEEILGTITNTLTDRAIEYEDYGVSDPMESISSFIDYMLWSLGYGDDSIGKTDYIDRIEASFKLDYGHYCFHSRLREMINWMIFSPGMYFTSALGEYFYDSSFHSAEEMGYLDLDKIPNSWEELDNKINVTLSDAVGDLPQEENIEFIRKRVTVVMTDTNLSEAINTMNSGINTLLFLKEPENDQQEILHKAILLDLLINYPEQAFFPYALTTIKPPILHNIESLDDHEISPVQPFLPLCYMVPKEKEEQRETQTLEIKSTESSSAKTSSISSVNYGFASMSINALSQSTSISSRDQAISSAKIKSQEKTIQQSNVRAASQISLAETPKEYEYVELNARESVSLKMMKMDRQ